MLSHCDACKITVNCAIASDPGPVEKKQQINARQGRVTAGMDIPETVIPIRPAVGKQKSIGRRILTLPATIPKAMSRKSWHRFCEKDTA